LRRFEQVLRGRPPAVEAWGWALVLAALAYAANVIGGAHAANPLTPTAMTNSIFAAGAFNLAAWIMLFQRAPHLLGRRPASLRLIVAMLALGLFCALPAPPVLPLVLAIMGLALFRQPDLTRAGRDAGWLLLALAGSLGAPFLRPLHAMVARIDAAIVVAAMRLGGTTVGLQGNLIIGKTSAIEVLTACASSAPLAGVILAFVMVVIYLRGRLDRADAPWLAASLAISIVLTEIRLSLMVPSSAAWDWWHNGLGNTIYELVALVFATLFPVIAALRNRARPVLAAQA